MKKNLATSACVFIASCVLYAQAAKLPPPRFEALGPAFLPKAVIAIIGILSLLDMLMTVIRAKKKVAAAKTELEDGEASPPPLFSIVLPTVSILYFISYILLVEYTDISYLALTFAYLVFGMWTLSLFRLRALVPVLCTAAGVTALIYLVFSVCLEIILP